MTEFLDNRGFNEKTAFARAVARFSNTHQHVFGWHDEDKPISLFERTQRKLIGLKPYCVSGSETLMLNGLIDQFSDLPVERLFERSLAYAGIMETRADQIMREAVRNTTIADQIRLEVDTFCLKGMRKLYSPVMNLATQVRYLPQVTSGRYDFEFVRVADSIIVYGAPVVTCLGNLAKGVRTSLQALDL